MPPSPLDDRVVVALSRPIRPQDLGLCLDSSSLGSATPGRSSHLSVIATTTTVSLKAANLTYMPSPSGSARSLNCGCSSASCCSVAAYDKDSQAQTQAIAAGTATTAVGTSTTCPANQMVNNNEHTGSLSLSGGVGSPVTGAPKQLASIKIIYPNDLAKKMTKGSKSHLPSQSPVIIDCRPFMEYNKSHIQGAVHINCADKISRRRLQQGKITVLDLISCREGKDSFKRIFSKEIIVYDENTNEPSRVMPSQPLHIVLESLKREGKDPLVLKGGLSSFKQNHENLCDNSLQLQECREAGAAAAAPGLLPQPVPSTPDIESAELTPILPFLFLGNEQDAQDLDTMQRLNIGYVINVTTHLPLYHYEKGLLNYKRLPATDSSKQNLRQYFEEAFEFIAETHESIQGRSHVGKLTWNLKLPGVCRSRGHSHPTSLICHPVPCAGPPTSHRTHACQQPHVPLAGLSCALMPVCPSPLCWLWSLDVSPVSPSWLNSLCEVSLQEGWASLTLRQGPCILSGPWPCELWGSWDSEV